MRKDTHEEFLNKYKEKQPEKSKLINIVGSYVSDSTPIECECNVCGYGKNGEWKPKPNKLKQGRGCPECAKKIIGQKNSGKKGPNKKLQKNYEEFLKEVYSKNKKSEHFKIIGYKEEWIGINNTEVDVMCLVEECKHKWSTFAYILKNSGCPECAKRINIEKQREKSIKKHEFIEMLNKDKPNIVLAGPYNGYTKYTKFKCNVHNHTWSSTPRDVLIQVYACNKCYTDSTRTDEDKIMQSIIDKKWDSELELIELIHGDDGTYAKLKHITCGNELIKKPYDFFRNNTIRCEHCSSDLDVIYMKMNNYPKTLLLEEYNDKFEVLGITDYQGGAKFFFRLKCNCCQQNFNKHYNSIESMKKNGSKLRCPYCEVYVGSNESRLAKYTKYLINHYFKEESQFEVITNIEIEGKIYKLRPDILISSNYKYHIEINGSGHINESGNWATDQEKYQAKIKYFKDEGYNLLEMYTNSRFIQETYTADEDIKYILDKCNKSYDDYEVVRKDAIEFAINSSIENIDKDKDKIFKMYLEEERTIKYITEHTDYSKEVILALFDKYEIEYITNYNKIVIVRNGEVEVYNGKGDVSRRSGIPGSGIGEYASGKVKTLEHYYSKHNAYVYTQSIWDVMSKDEKEYILELSKLDNYIVLQNGEIFRRNTRRTVESSFNVSGVSDYSKGYMNHYYKKNNIYIYTREKWLELSEEEREIEILKSRLPEYIIVKGNEVFGASTNIEMQEKFNLSSQCNSIANGRSKHYYKSKEIYIIKKEKLFEYYNSGIIFKEEILWIVNKYKIEIKLEEE